MIRVVSLNILIVIFILIFLELIIRFFNFVELQGYDEKAFYNDGNVTLFTPNTITKVQGKKLKTDKHGFRIPIDSYYYDENKKSVLILGDSVSYGVSVEEKKTFIGLLRKKVNKNILNASVIGHNLNNYNYLLKKYEYTIPKFTDVIIFLCLNDIIFEKGIVKKKNLKEITRKETDNLFVALLQNHKILELNFYLRDKSALYNLVKGIGTNTIKRYYNYIIPYYQNNAYLEEYKKNIKEIVKYSKQKNISVKFVLLPYKYQLKENCKNKYMKPQEQIQKIFMDLNYQLFDMTKDFCKEKTKNKLILNFDPMHLSPEGHKFVSRLLIKKNLIH